MIDRRQRKELIVAYEMLMGLLVTDDSGYTRYREEMLPILEEHGGGFRYDFRVSEVLRTQAGHEINRVFTICFPDKSARASFFADDRYREVRKNFFDESVEGSTLIAEYDIAGETL